MLNVAGDASKCQGAVRKVRSAHWRCDKGKLDAEACVDQRLTSDRICLLGGSLRQCSMRFVADGPRAPSEDSLAN